MQISVVIPAYNEAKVIAKTIQEVQDYLAKHFTSFEVIVVDDGSTDKTGEILDSLSSIKVLHNLKNHGKGYTVAKGVKQAQGDLILFMDADNSTRITELDKFLLHTSDYQLLIASRGLPGSDIKISQNFIKVFFGKSGNFLSRCLIDSKIYDTQCGFKLFVKDLQPLFAKLTVPGFAFDFELIWLAKRHHFKIKEIPVIWRNNFDSTVRWHDYPRTILTLFKIRFNDLKGKYN
ncbi:MAG: dolichyl-phosphate beta-glucosyltransferase [Patescibacteria group bacterium]